MPKNLPTTECIKKIEKKLANKEDPKQLGNESPTE